PAGGRRDRPGCAGSRSARSSRADESAPWRRNRPWSRLREGRPTSYAHGYAMPICQPLSSPVIVPDEEAFVVPLAIGEAEAEKTAREAILSSFLRPYDIQHASIS